MDAQENRGSVPMCNHTLALRAMSAFVRSTDMLR